MSKVLNVSRFLFAPSVSILCIDFEGGYCILCKYLISIVRIAHYNSKKFIEIISIAQSYSTVICKMSTEVRSVAAINSYDSSPTGINADVFKYPSLESGYHYCLGNISNILIIISTLIMFI